MDIRFRKVAPTIAAACVVTLAGCGSSKSGVSAKNESFESVAKKSALNGLMPKPGEWQETMTIEKMAVTGAPPQMAAAMQKQIGKVQTFSTCLTPDDVAHMSADFFQGGKASGCIYQKFEMADGKIDAVGTCKDGASTRNMTMQGQYGDQEYNIHATSDGEMSPGMHMDMAMSMSSKRVGDCKS